jgi:tRNA nucleotidyltransferase (CCA-adding enzyme)
MKNRLLDKLSPKQLRLIKIIGRLAKEDKSPAYLVGGIVRDFLLVKANLDLDIVIEGDGIKFARRLAGKIKCRPVYHQKFGTASLLLLDNSKIDVATARREIYEFPGALPEVSPGTIEDDLLRRDFSINALAVQLDPGSPGTLVDYCGGRQDLSRKRIRILHDLSFIEDPTRILRAIRFKERFNFSFEAQTLSLIKEAMAKKAFASVKPTRLFAEMVKLLKEPPARRNILTVDRLCGWDFINPKIKIGNNTRLLLAAAEREIKWFQKQFPLRRKLDTWLIYFMAIVDRLSFKEKNKLGERFNLKAGDRKRIESCRSIERALKSLARVNMKPSQVYAVLEPLSYETLILLKAMNHSALANRRIIDFLRFSNPARISIKGADLIGISGQGDKKIGQALLKVLHARIDGKNMSRAEELRLAKRLISQK